MPNRVHVLAGGRILRSGGPELALELEASGYAGRWSRRPHDRYRRKTGVGGFPGAL